MTAKLFAITCGHLTLPTLILIAGREGHTTVPVTCYLVEHPRGRVVFDTGLNIKTLEDPAAYVGQVLASLHQFDYSTGEDIGSRLESINVSPGSVTYVINSHLHFDHCGGNALLPNATILVQRLEVENALGDEAHFRGYLSADFNTGQDVRLIDGEHDLFGDGSVVLFPTYGHTPGHQSLRVGTDNGEFVLCGDACYLKETLDTLALPGAVTDREAFTRSLHLLRALQHNGANIMYGHDIEFWKNVPQAPARVG